MKKVLLILILLLFASTAVFSSSIDYRGNQSADYNRTFVRNASLDSGDIVNYNPAGTAFMKDGWHLSLANQFFFKEYTITAGGTDYATDAPSLLVPSFYAVYKKDRLALFGAFTIPAGGGTLKYENGVPMTAVVPGAILAFITGNYTGATGALSSADLQASSMYYGITLGGSFAITKNISVSLSARYMFARQEFTGKIEYIVQGGVSDGVVATPVTQNVDTEVEAGGLGGIIGVDIKVSDKMNIGLRYETTTVLEFETTVHGSDLNGLFVDGKNNKDLPGLLGVGVSYHVSPELKVGLAFVLYFLKAADGDAYANYDNGFDLSVGVEYAVSSRLTLSAGYLYSKVGGNSDTYNDLDYALDNSNVSLGIKYGLSEMIDVSFATVVSFYKAGENASGTEEFNKDVLTFALGFNFKL